MGIALVTGTSTGIGLATSITLARAGHTVFAGIRNLERGAELRHVAAKETLPVTVVELDVDSDSSVEKGIGKILADHGHIDVLVNNAGIGLAELLPLTLYRQIMETNFFGSMRCIKAVLPSMRQRQSGCVINVTSIAGRFGSAMQSAYAASKWAREGLSEALAQEVKSFNVRVSIVEPGVIATPMTMRERPKPPPNPYSNQIEEAYRLLYGVSQGSDLSFRGCCHDQGHRRWQGDKTQKSVGSRRRVVSCRATLNVGRKMGRHGSRERWRVGERDQENAGP